MKFLLDSEFAQDILDVLVIDYTIYNHDRHGSNLELLYDMHRDLYRMVPPFDHGCCLTAPLFNTWSDKTSDYYLMDSPVNNFPGTTSLKHNLTEYCVGRRRLLYTSLPDSIMEGLDVVLGKEHCSLLYEMLQARYAYALETLNV